MNIGTVRSLEGLFVPCRLPSCCGSQITTNNNKNQKKNILRCPATNNFPHFGVVYNLYNLHTKGNLKRKIRKFIATYERMGYSITAAGNWHASIVILCFFCVVFFFCVLLGLFDFFFQELVFFCFQNFSIIVWVCLFHFYVCFAYVHKSVGWCVFLLTVADYRLLSSKVVYSCSRSCNKTV